LIYFEDRLSQQNPAKTGVKFYTPNVSCPGSVSVFKHALSHIFVAVYCNLWYIANVCCFFMCFC